MNPYQISGMVAGVAGLLTFLIIHHFWIQPIWFILPVGLVLALLGGLAAGSSYQLIESRLPPYPWSFLGFTLLIMIILAPSMIISEFTPAPFGLDGSLAPGYTGWKAFMQFVIELMIPATLMGAAAGWLLVRTSQASLSTALAGLIYALGPGHNIPFLGNTPGVWKGITLLLVINLVAALALMLSLKFLQLQS